MNSRVVQFYIIFSIIVQLQATVDYDQVTITSPTTNYGNNTNFHQKAIFDHFAAQFLNASSEHIWYLIALKIVLWLNLEVLKQFTT